MLIYIYKILRKKVMWMIQFNRSFGAHSNLKHEIKILGPIYLTDLIVLISSFVLINYFKFFFINCKSPIPQTIFNICAILLSIYSIIRPSSNPQKRNYQLLFLSFQRNNNFFRSINVSVFEPTSMIFNKKQSS